jgi:uncharacterized membrane protein
MTNGTTQQAYTITGVFPNETAARSALTTLASQGYNDSQVSVVAEQTDSNQPGKVSDDLVTRAPQGLVIGLVVGIVVGGLIGFLLGQPDNSLGMASVGAAVGAALGILAGSMSGLGMTRQEAKGLAKRVEQGAWLVSLQHTNSRSAADDMRRSGALDIRIQSPKLEPFKSEA